jgi:predicted protein tyrosine phosphatase
MADLSYSLELLNGMGRELTALADALEGNTQRTSWDAEEVGHRKVSDALEDFADSWDDRRELLTKALRDVGRMATDSATTFKEIDDELAADVRGIMEPQ